MGQQSGYNAKIAVNGQAYGGATWSVRETTNDVETDNTQGITGGALGIAVAGFSTRVPGTTVAEVTISQATFDTAQNPFQAPFSIDQQTYIVLDIYPAGLDGPSYSFPSLLILESNYNGTAKEGQPLEFTGKSDGAYSVPAD